jgi:DNA repair exonuclease SbcCD ATPase subunit
MGRLAIRQVEYRGDNYSFTSPTLGDGLVIIEGANGTGKTTFTDLVYFGLGGNPDQFRSKSNNRHKEICADKNNEARLTIEIDDELIVLTRRFGDDSGDIIVSPLNSSVSTVLRVHRREDGETFSDWLLARLGLSGVPIQMGTRTWKLGFTDIMRLLYHDQSAANSRIFKRADSDNFVSDSGDQRRAIFEILIGASSELYYHALAAQRRAHADFEVKQAALKAYAAAAEGARQGQSDLDLNESFLRSRVTDLEEMLERTNAHRRKIRDAQTVEPANEEQLLELRERLASSEMKTAGLDQALRDVSTEAARLADLQAQLIEEVVRVRKIIHAHETLDLFSPDTCPCCLRLITRQAGTCICGQQIDEGSFQRFFYTSDEYITILKSKQKNVQTVSEAIRSCQEEQDHLRKKRETERENIRATRNSIARWVGRDGRYTTELDVIDDRIVELRVELEHVQRLIIVERERDSLQKAVDNARSVAQQAKKAAEAARIAAEEERQAMVARFDAAYTTLLRDTLGDVRTARLADDYEPIINDGEYREHSSSVARRLMYYLTLFKMSLVDGAVRSPRLLLIDTPETAGIDKPELKAAIGKIQEVLTEPGIARGQVILTTGIAKYPAALKSCVKLSLDKSHRLLQLKAARSPG